MHGVCNMHISFNISLDIYANCVWIQLCNRIVKVHVYNVNEDEHGCLSSYGVELCVWILYTKCYTVS